VDDDSHDDADNESDELEFQIKAPPMRTKEKHGACKRKRKEAGKGKKSKTVGRTHTPSYACAATTKAEKQKARQVCARCLKAGRPSNGVRHKGKMCPFALGPAPEDSAFKCPELPRLRVKAHTYNVLWNKPRILAIVGNEPVFVME
jgi:hypothetical protein